MLRFWVSFTVYIVILTTFPFFPLFLLLTWFFILYTLLEYYGWVTAWDALKSFWYVFLAAIISFFSVFLSHRTLNQGIQNLPEEWPHAITWSVLQWLKNNDFLLKTIYGTILLRKADEVYEYWDTLLVNWFVSPVDKDWQNQLFVKKLSNIVRPWVLKWEFDYDMRLWTKWYIWDLYIKNTIVLDHKETIWYITYMRQYIKSRIQEVYWNVSHQALLNGMLTWDISRMTKKEYQWYIDSNLVHLVAVSGGNIVMLVIMLHYILFFLPYKFRIWVISLSVIWYSLLVGLDASVFRAMLMWMLTLFALIFWRSNQVSRSILFAWIILLIWKPYSLIYDLWFLLSFWALFGIIVFQKLVSPHISAWKKRTKSLFSEYFLANMGATLWVFPILIFFIGSVNIFWFVANIFVLPIVPVTMYIWAVSLIVPHTLFSTFVGFLLDYIAYISEFVWLYGMYVSVDSFWVKWLFALCMYLFYSLFFHFFSMSDS